MTHITCEKVESYRRNKLIIFIFLYRYNANMELEDAIHTAILTLKEGFEGQMTEDNIEVGICDQSGFRKLPPSEIKDYLDSILS